MIDKKMFCLYKFLGSGASGAAYQASREGQEDVVVKIFKILNYGIDINTDESFQQEVDALENTGRLIYADFNFKIVIQKLIQGKTFAQVLAEFVQDYQDSKMTESSREELLDGLIKYFSAGKDFNEKFGLIHGDIRPFNAINTPENELELVDFGSTHQPDPERLSRTLQKDYDYSKLELYYYVSKLMVFKPNSSLNDYYRHLLILRGSLYRHDEASNFCSFYETKFNCGGLCQKLDEEDDTLNYMLNEILGRNREDISKDEVLELLEKFTRRFMFVQEGKLRSLLKVLEG